MKNKNIRNVPTLRFPGFEGEWERCKVGDIATTTIGEFVIKTKQNDSYPYPVYNGGRTNTGFYDKYNNEGNKILVSARGNAGFVNIIKTRYWAGNSCYSIDIIDKNKNNVDFTYYEMKLKENVFIKNQQSATIPSVSKSAVENFELLKPLIQEQNKIGSFLATIDALISETEKELEVYREQKRGMLQKMFPKKGADVPEIRFSEFTGAWEQRKVSDLFETVESGNRLPKTMICKGNIPYVVASNENNGIVDYISENQNDFHGNRMKLFAENSITFSIDNPEAIFVQKVPFFTSNIMRVLHNDKYNYYHIVCFSELIKGLTSYYNWSFKFSGPVVMSSDVFVPVKSNGNIDLAEIEKIGKTLSELDNLISLHQRELDKLIELKKGFMQKMFC